MSMVINKQILIMVQPIRELHSETNKEVITLLLHQLNIIILHMCSCNIAKLFPVSIETKLDKVLDILSMCILERVTNLQT